MALWEYLPLLPRGQSLSSAQAPCSLSDILLIHSPILQMSERLPCSRHCARRCMSSLPSRSDSKASEGGVPLA